MSSKLLVLVVGATGHTGKPIIDALLESGNFAIAALTRPSSASKPEIVAIQSKGVQIRVGDYISDPPAKLHDVLEGVDILVSVVSAEAIEAQKSMFAAAVAVGVKRIVPCDFGTPGKAGVRTLHDAKLGVRGFLKDICDKSEGKSAYTFIDIGWWMQLAVPESSKKPALLGPSSCEYYSIDDKKVLLTNVDHVGEYVVRIVADLRTIDSYVIVWEDELTLAESREIAEKASGEADELKKKRVILTEDDIIKRAEAGKQEYAQKHDFVSHAVWTFSEYMLSIHFLGEDSLANAKALGALDVRELYPDIVPQTFQEFSEEYYNATSSVDADYMGH